jgi:hypothetical protein
MTQFTIESAKFWTLSQKQKRNTPKSIPLFILLIVAAYYLDIGLPTLIIAQRKPIVEAEESAL